MTPSAPRPLAAAAVAGGLAWIVFAVITLAAGQTQDEGKVELNSTGDYVGFSLFAVALALSVAAVLALHLHQRGADGRLGRAGAIVASAGAAAQSIVIGAFVVNGAETSWFGIAAPLAILTWVVGSALLGVAVHRAGLMPRWVGILLPVVTVFAIVGANGGTSVLIGVFQIVVGLRILRAAAAGVSVPQTARRAREQPA